jgi:hypothetical protein
MGSDVNILIFVITGCYVQDKGFGDASGPDLAIEKRKFAALNYLSFLMIEPAPEETSYWRLLFQEIIPGKKGNKLITFLFQVFPPSFKTIN